MQAKQKLVAIALGALSAMSVTASLAGPAQASALGPDPALSTIADPAWWGTNGRVNDILTAGNRVYLAGGFDYVGPASGYGVGVDGTAGLMQPGAPVVDGVVRAAVADGQGGWYLGGDFKYVAGQYRRHAAQITAAGAVTNWNPKPDQPVRAIAFDGTSVFLGGSFSTVKDLPASGIAAVAPAGVGDPVAGWSAGADGRVDSLVVAGGGLFVGGEFGVVSGTPRSRLARLDAATGALDPTFGAGTDGPVRALALSPDGATLYAGGEFSQASGAGRSRLAAFATAGGAMSPWAPGANGTVVALAVDPAAGTVYAGGLFSSVGGADRGRLAAIDPAGAVTGFDAGLNGCHVRHTVDYAHSNPPCDPEVGALTATAGLLYVGGRFGRSGLTERHDAAAFSLADGVLQGWNPVASDRVLALGGSGSNIFVGGELTSVNGVVRANLAALDVTTGRIDPSFAPVVDDTVLDIDLAPGGTRLYLGGHFTMVGGKKHNRMAAVFLADGKEDRKFKPNFNDDVLELAVVGNDVYAAGQFKKVSGVARGHVAKLDPLTGTALAGWKADTIGPKGVLTANGMVQSIEVSPDGSKVYLAGPFDKVNGVARRGIAVVSGIDGAMLPNQLGGLQGCWVNGAWAIHIYLSPDGKRLYGGDVCPDHIYQWDAVNLSTPSNPTGLIWRSWCNAGMQGTLEINGHFFYGSHGGDKGSGGRCSQTPGGADVEIARYAVFDQVNGNLLPDRVAFDSPMGVWSFATVPGGLLVGGDFTFVGGPQNVHQGLALLRGAP